MARPDPDERTFRQHLAGARFMAGVDRGDWRLVHTRWTWPNPIMALSATPHPAAPDEFVLRFTVDSYPALAPTAGPWDVEHDAVLAHDLWPTGGRVTPVFNPQWNANALYLPCDRLAIAGHDGWQDQYKALLWDPSKDITHYLNIVHELLHSDGYSGIRRAA